MKNHNLVEHYTFQHIQYERRPARAAGKAVDGLFNAWIILNNPRQLNSYTTDMLKEIIIAFQQASMDRAVVNVVLTAVGDRAFCSGGNTEEYSEYYAGNPQEYKQYMRLFNDMIDTILRCDKPVINRVNGIRVAGGQEMGLACDFTLAADTARFGQAGPKHGSAPDGGATDFLPLYVGYDRAMECCALCEPWSAHKAYHWGLVSDIAPVLKLDGQWLANPLVYTDSWLDAWGRLRCGEWQTGDDLAKAEATLKRATVDFSRLDELVESYCYKLMMTMPDCLMKTITSLRKFKRRAWDETSTTNREWLALNMMTEAKAGFRAFHRGPKNQREVDFIALRRLLAAGRPWTDELIREISPPERA